MNNSNRTSSQKRITSLLMDFDVKSENELYNKLIQESVTIPCIICGREFPVEELVFLDGNPYCLNCDM